MSAAAVPLRSVGAPRGAASPAGVPPGWSAAATHVAVERLRALADPARLTMLTMLAASPTPRCVCHLNDAVALEQPTVSHHLRVLRDAGLVVGKREGSWVYYELHPGAAAWVRSMLAALTA